LLIEGRSNDDIASALFVARRTVETHRQRIMKKLGAHTIADLVHIASRLGVVR
jgi:two-component system, LuxR family, secretion system response regulator SsrB